MVLILLKDMLYKDCFSRILLSRNYLRCFKMALLCSLVKYLYDFFLKDTLFGNLEFS